MNSISLYYNVYILSVISYILIYFIKQKLLKIWIKLYIIFFRFILSMFEVRTD